MAPRALTALLLLGACGSPPLCPPGLHEDAARARSLYALLRDLPDAAPLTAGPAPPICFGQAGEGVLSEDGVVRLSGAGPLPAEAARLAHLLKHRREGPPLPPPDGRPCGLRVADAMRAEGEAYALEARVRAALGVEGPAPQPTPQLTQDYQRRCEADAQ